MPLASPLQLDLVAMVKLVLHLSTPYQGTKDAGWCHFFYVMIPNANTTKFQLNSMIEVLQTLTIHSSAMV